MNGDLVVPQQEDHLVSPNLRFEKHCLNLFHLLSYSGRITIDLFKRFLYHLSHALWCTTKKLKGNMVDKHLNKNIRIKPSNIKNRNIKAKT